jgi:hypothetical protein
MKKFLVEAIALSWLGVIGVAMAQADKPTPGMARHLTAAFNQGHPRGKKTKNYPTPTATAVPSYSATPGNTFGNHGSNPSTATGSTSTLNGSSNGTNASNGNGNYVGGTYGNGNGSVQ